MLNLHNINVLYQNNRIIYPMKNKRVIARLDVKNDALVKGIHLEGLRVLGKPGQFARHYYNEGIDELIYMDVVASLYGRNSLKELVEETAKEIFVPLTVGGGIRTAMDVRELLRSGADKVAINTAATKSPELIRELANTFGSSTISVAIETIYTDEGRYEVYVDNGRQYTGLDAVEWAQEVESLGAGEIIITSVDNEGTGRGFDLDIISRICSAVGIPVIAHGGAGKAEDLCTVLTETTADAACVASILHYHTVTKIEQDISSVSGNTNFMSSGQIKKNLTATSVENIKTCLSENGVGVRMKY